MSPIPAGLPPATGMPYVPHPVRGVRSAGRWRNRRWMRTFRPQGGPVMAESVLPVRSALEELRLEFPAHRICQRVIRDRLFYIAEATAERVQPRFAQAQDIDRLRARLAVPEAEFNPAAPSIARVYDVLMGGKDNFVSINLWNPCLTWENVP